MAIVAIAFFQAASISNLCHVCKLQTLHRDTRCACGKHTRRHKVWQVSIGLLSSWNVQEIKAGHRQINKNAAHSCEAYHFDPAFRGSKESQNNSFRSSFPSAMKRTVQLSHFFSFCSYPQSCFPPCCCSIQTDKNAEAAFAGGIGDWSSGIIWAFCQALLKGHRTVSRGVGREAHFSL